MISTITKREKFYGWTALAGAMLVYFGMCGDISYAFGVFLPVMGEDFAWSRSALSGAFTTFWVVGGLLGPLAGISISRFGARKSIIISNIIAVLGLLGMSWVQEVWHVYLFFGVLLGIGIAFGEFIPTTAIVNNWFIRRRALAMSLLFASGGISGFAFPPMISWLISGIGWRLTWVCLAGIHLILAVILGGILVRNKPEELGQVPDGKTIGAIQEATAGSPPVSRVYQTKVDWKVRDAIRTPALWLIMIFSAAGMFTLSFLMLHQVAYLQDLDFSHMKASTTFGLLVGMSILGRLVCGALGTRFESRYLAAAFLALFAIGMVILVNAKTLPFIYLYAVLSGISYGALIVLQPAIFGAYFGRTYYAEIVGWTAPVMTVVCAASPLLGAFLYDITGSYLPTFWVAIGFLGLGLVCALLARPPRPPNNTPPGRQK